MASSFSPPKVAEIPLPNLITLIAHKYPRRDFIQIIRDQPDHPINAISFTWAEVIQHAQGIAADLSTRWAKRLEDSTQKQLAQPREAGSSPVVVGVLGANGYQLYANVLACILNRWTVLLVSSKNSVAAVEHLLRTTKSSLLLVDSNNMELGRTMEKSIRGLTAQAFTVLEPTPPEPASSPLAAPSKEQLEKEMNIPVFYLHTSGSTGHPKAVPWSHEFVLSGIRGRLRDGGSYTGLPVYCLPPIIHAMGAVLYFVFAIAHGHIMTFVSSPVPKPPSATSLLAYLPFIRDGMIMVPPSVLEELYRMGPEAIDKVVKGVKYVTFGGAPLKKEIGGALVAAGMNLSTGFGATEIGAASMKAHMRKPEDWQYIYFRDGYEWHQLPVDDNSNLREFVVGPGWDACPAVINHENLRGYATGDLWEPHPTVPGLWKHAGRAGNITVLSNGEKTDNGQIEGLLLEDKHILYVQVFGAGRPLSGALLQRTDVSVPTVEFLSQIQPTIDRANKILPKHSKLVPELIIVAPSERPFITTDKGTIKRKETLANFEQDIERAYEALEQGDSGLQWEFDGRLENEDHVKKFLRKVVRTLLDQEIPDEGDLFEHGLDSLLSIRLRAALVSITNKALVPPQSIAQNIVYNFPSINGLASYVVSQTTSDPTRSLRDAKDDCIRKSIATYSANFISHKPGSKVAKGKVFALSGSTGSVGSSMLGLLLEREDIEKVYLLNRKGKETQKVRQTRSLIERGLDPDILERKADNIVYLDVDFSRSDLGLAAQDYENLRDNVTHIIHAAWHLNFNLILESYERVHVAGVRHLVDLALSSPQAKSPRFIFLSTIGAAGKYRGPTQDPSTGERAGQVLVPEEPIDDSGMALDQGYGQSKYVGERIVVQAVNAGLRATVVRIGQLSGVTTNGAWATSEHVPIMLRSSLAMGLIPDDFQPVRWVPSDIAAAVILKLALQDSATLHYFSVENPFPTPWKVISQGASAVSTKPLRSVTLQVWLDHIRKSNPDPKDVPAVKLLDFYQKMTSRGDTTALGWEKSLGIAPELAVGLISEELVGKYVLYQQSKGSQL